ncbi:MAG TPA: MFS transporter [Solirubrobacteraceae bacterium]|nr:MFS transporter [Solirubrobacteraceae bacterium]
MAHARSRGGSGAEAAPIALAHTGHARLGMSGSSRRWWVLGVLCLPLLIVSLDNTVLNVVLPTLVRKLHATTSELQWIVDAYVLVFGGLLLVAGSLADRIGRKRTFVVGLVVFAAGSSWAAFSGSVGLLIAARASMGIGAALIMPSTLSIITAVFTGEGERQRAFGFWSATSGAGVALGPIIGGLLLAHFWWGSVFLINVPVAVLAVLCALPLVPDSRDPHASAPDPGGSLLSIAGLGLLLWGIIEAPVHGWSSTIVLGCAAAGIATLVGFVAWERSSSHPMLNLHYFGAPRFAAAVVCNGLLMFGLYGALFVLTQLLQFQLGYSPLQAGVRVLPAAGAIAVVAPLSTVLVRKLGSKLTVLAGLLIVAGGLWQISGASVSTSYGGVVIGMVMLGCGAGLVIPASTGAVMGSVPSAHTGVGSATNGSFMQVGGAMGVGIIGSLLSTRYQHRLTPTLAPYHLPHAVQQTILGSLGGALTVAGQLGGMTGRLLAAFARAAFVSGMDLGLLVGACIALAGALVAALALPARADADDARR